jgi:hypothetical protein
LLLTHIPRPFSKFAEASGEAPGTFVAEGIVMLPVNYAIAAKSVVFRTAPDTLLAAQAHGPASFQSDRVDEANREGWSVSVQGHAHIVAGEREVRSLERQTRLEPWAGGARDVWVRITPVRITGRRRGCRPPPPGPTPLPRGRAKWCADRMMTGAKIILNTGMDAARDKLAELARASWMMSLPRRRAAYARHPAGRGRPGARADGEAGLVAVMFGDMAAPAPDRIVLPVIWEPVEPGDEFTVQLQGNITLAPATEHGHIALTLAGFCGMPPAALTADRREQVRLEFMEASREFVTSVARDITGDVGPGPEQDLTGPSWAW